MDEIKLRENKVRRSRGSFFMPILIVIILGCIGYATFFILNNRIPSFDPLAYYAVFLENGQVYFGKIENMSRGDIVMSKVYYLQVADNSTGQLEDVQSRFNLVKLGSELHGPTDELFINKNKVLFYEKLRQDSKVVESIKAL